MKTELPKPTIERLISIHTAAEHSLPGTEVLSSAELSELTGYTAHSIRKDLSALGNAEGSASGYSIDYLKNRIAEACGLKTARKVCIAGLGRLGTAILKFLESADGNLKLCAGFDISTNQLELIQSRIPLYPAYRMTEIIRKEGIEYAILAVPAEAAESTAEKLAEGGIKGIVNFSSAFIQAEQGTIIRNVNVMSEFNIITAILNSKGEK
jgi:redox-sensing transcriptional repressor